VVYEKNMYVPGSRAVVSYVTNIRLIFNFVVRQYLRKPRKLVHHEWEWLYGS